MTRSRLTVIALALAGILLMSGCFELRAFRWSAFKAVRGGKRVVALMGLNPYGGQAPIGPNHEKDRPFVLILLSDNASDPSHWRVVAPKVFDYKKKFGPRRKLVRDNDLRDFIFDQDACAGETFGDATDAVLLRTETEVNGADDRVARQALTKVGIKATQGVEGSTDWAFRFIVGGWDDVNGNSLPDPESEEDGSEVYCAGFMDTSLPARNG
jgi:hypothetical protein